MITVRKSADRGHMDHGWLDTRHTFSWDEFQDPDWEAFGKLLAANTQIVEFSRGTRTAGCAVGMTRSRHRRGDPAVRLLQQRPQGRHGSPLRRA